MIYFDNLAQDCSNSSATAMELLQSYAKPSIYAYIKRLYIVMNAYLWLREAEIPGNWVLIGQSFLKFYFKI